MSEWNPNYLNPVSGAEFDPTASHEAEWVYQGDPVVCNCGFTGLHSWFLHQWMKRMTRRVWPR